MLQEKQRQSLRVGLGKKQVGFARLPGSAYPVWSLLFKRLSAGLW